MTDIRIREVILGYENHTYRTPIKFGGVVLDRATLLNVDVTVETRNGTHAQGFGSMPLGNIWSFPSRELGYETTLSAMKRLAERMRQLAVDCTESGHPIDLGVLLEPARFDAARAVEMEMGLAEPIPKLCTLVVASPFDAAVHDAFGKLHGRSVYHCYGSDFLPRDLGHYLGTDFADLPLDRFILTTPKPRMPLYHLVGALDALSRHDVQQPVGDGLPETLREWILHDGLTHLKIKLNGDDLDWDVERVVCVDRIAAEAQQERGIERWFYSLDFNERCQSVDYLLEFLRRLQERTAAGFERVQYIEQPTHRDLTAHPENRMHAAARIRPIVIDESLIDLESLMLARALGYTGVALKACKGQTQALLMAAVAQKLGMFLCVQDLTCPGASLIHSAGLAAHIPGVAAIEANARQYMPAANAPWGARFPGLFQINDGTMATSELTGPGLGAVPCCGRGS
jgi:L-alanine-DL-glutamate epimerase-like enolase superfamily enzyme